MDPNYKKIFATIAAEDFVGRESETEILSRRANASDDSRGLFLSHAPAAGASELLKQFYDRLFSGQSDLVPVYFALKETDKTARSCAVRFLQTFITQIVAFRHQDARILDIFPDICELAELAAPEDAYWIERLTASCRIETPLNDDRAFIRNCLSAPLRAAAYGTKSFVMIDNLHEADFFTMGGEFLENIKEIFSRSNAPFILAGRRRFLLNAARSGDAKLDAEILRVEPLNFASAGVLAENLAGKLDVKINEQTRDLMARQFGGNPALIKFMLSAAGERRADLDSYQRVGRIYTDELFGGRIGNFYDSMFRKIAPNAETQKTIIELLYDALTGEENVPPDVWRARLSLKDEDFNSVVSLLNSHEIIRLSFNRIEAAGDDETLSDYINARFRLEIAAENRAAAVGAAMSGFLVRAPQLMAKFYRRKASVNLRDLLGSFNCQETPLNFLDYSIFENADDAEISESEIEKIRLPQIVYTAHTGAFYPAFNQITDETRSAVALGFEERAYTNAAEIVWIAAEIESKLEASRETAEFWCDRLEMVALTCNFPKYKIWLVAPEGFSPEASEILRRRNAFGSSRKQIERLARFLDAGEVTEKSPANEYEIVVPMGEDTELIAAHTIEEIARRYAFEPKAINQIKTALVEACINATEHSLSPDRKIYQKFRIEADKIIITISNRGLRLLDKNLAEVTPENGRRGWGLKLMKTLMDEVKIEAVDDGTRISMTKYLK